MARVYAPASSAAPLLAGAVGGLVGGLGTLAVLAGAALLRGQPVLVPLNAIGAWLVRWLQTAGDDAFTHFYYDATLGGAASVLVAAVGVGILFGAVMSRMPQDHPLAWGLVTATVLFVAGWWKVLPAIDPVAVRLLMPSEWLAAMVAYGFVLGIWMHGDRAIRAGELPVHGA